MSIKLSFIGTVTNLICEMTFALHFKNQLAFFALTQGPYHTVFSHVLRWVVQRAHFSPFVFVHIFVHTLLYTLCAFFV
jgi:hypothetical protein